MGLYEERLQNIKDAVSFRKPARVPWASNVFNWVAVNSPYTLMDLLHDPAKVTESYCKLAEDYSFDTMFFTTLLSNYIEITDPLGGAVGHVIDNEKNSVQVKDLTSAVPDMSWDVPNWLETEINFFKECGFRIMDL